MAHFDTAGMTATFTQPINILEAASQAAQLKNLLLEGNRNQADYNAKKAQGNALAQATSPDGSIDYGKVRANYAANQDAHYGMGDAVTQSQQQEGGALAVSQAQNNALNGILSFVGTHPDSEHLNAAGRMAKAVLPPSMTSHVGHVINSIQQHPDGIAGGIKQILNSEQSPETQQQNIYGTAGNTINNGSHTLVGTQQSAMNGGQFQPTTSVQQNLSPGQAATPVNITLPNGQESQTNLDNFTHSLNQQNSQEAALEGLGNGRYPQQSPLQKDRGLKGILGPVPGTTDAQRATAQAGAQGANALNELASHRNDRQALLRNMAQDAEGFTSGPGLDTLRHYEAGLANLSGISINPSDVESAQSFNKFSQQLAQQQAASLGTGTDGKLASAIASIPNSGLQIDTNKRMIHQLMGNEDAINAKATAWQKSGLSPDQFQQWNQHFSQTFDPRAYQLQRMAPNERQNFISSLKKSGQLDEFRHNYNEMHKNGLLNRGDN